METEIADKNIEVTNKLSFIMELNLVEPVKSICNESVTELFWFIEGFRYGAGLVDAHDPLYAGFSDWVQKRFRFPEGPYGWTSVMLYKAFGSESRAFELTKKMWFEYKAEMEEENSTA